MPLISIIPGFKAKNDDRILSIAESLKPDLHYHLLESPVVCELGLEKLSMEQLSSRPLFPGNEVILDFGKHLVGHVSLSFASCGCHQDAPAYISLNLAEVRQELNEKPDDYHGWLSKSWIQNETFHIDLLPAEIDLKRRYAFRFIKLTVIDTSPKFQIRFIGVKCQTESSADLTQLKPRTISDPILKSIYQVSLNTLADCTQQVLEDGPKRDQRLWLGDLRLQALTSYCSFRSYNLIKRCLYLFAGTRFPDGRMSANVFTSPEPEADDTYLADYALMYPIALLEYLEETNDLQALSDLAEPALEQVDYVIRNSLNSDGIIKAEAAKDSFIDWSDTLERTISLQGVLICALEAASKLSALKQDPERGQHYAKLTQDLRSQAFKLLWSDAENCFTCGGQISPHSQIWMILSGTMPKDKAETAITKALNDKDAPRMTTPYMHHYYVMALLKAGLRDKALEHLKTYWGSMVDVGADTFWECWDPEHPDASPYGGLIVNSFCHAWSCTPAYIIDHYFS